MPFSTDIFHMGSNVLEPVPSHLVRSPFTLSLFDSDIGGSVKGSNLLLSATRARTQGELMHLAAFLAAPREL